MQALSSIAVALLAKQKEAVSKLQKCHLMRLRTEIQKYIDELKDKVGGKKDGGQWDDHGPRGKNGWKKWLAFAKETILKDKISLAIKPTLKHLGEASV